MSTLSDCCSPCSTVTTTAIPGAQGPAGAAGAAGADGVSAFAIVQAPGFTIPTVGNDVLAPVSDTTWMAVGEVVIAGTGFGGPVCGPANFLVISINSATTVTLRALAYTGDAVNPSTIATSALLAPAGLQGPAGVSLPTTTAGDLVYNTDGVAGHSSRLGIGVQGQSIFADPFNGAPASVIAWKGAVQSLELDVSTKGTGADLTEDTLQSFSIVGNTLRTDADTIEWEALFNVQATGTVATKTIKVYFGTTVVLQFGNAALDGGSVIMRGTIVRTGAATQICYATYVTTNSGGTSTTLASQTNASETLSGAVLFKCTGQNGTNAIANGIQQQILKLSRRAA